MKEKPRGELLYVRVRLLQQNISCICRWKNKRMLRGWSPSSWLFFKLLQANPLQLHFEFLFKCVLQKHVGRSVENGDQFFF